MVVGTELAVPVEALAFMGAAFELLHEASLVHDDIEDGDRMRRGQPTVWARYGVFHAINLGDYLINQAFMCIARLPSSNVPRILALCTEQLSLVVRGQGLDLNLRATDSPTLCEYHRMVEHKTVPLLTLASVAPAYFAGAPPETVKALTDFSRLFGTCYQIRDDALDLFGRKRRPIGSDLVAGARSFLVCYVLERASREDAAELLKLSGSFEAATDSSLAMIRSIVQRHGALDAAKEACTRYAAEWQASSHALSESLRLNLSRCFDYLLESMP
jgi:geranylgeranyl diphosphate synthase, type I